MPLILQGDLWKSGCDVICVTTNGCVKNSALLMGAGAAGEAKERFPLLPRHAYDNLIQYYPAKLEGAKNRWYYLYGLMLLKESANGRETKLGLFQTKGLVSQPSPLALIGYSVMKLTLYANDNRHRSIALNYPGIGHGGLSAKLVRPLLDPLPSNVHVYYRMEADLL